MLAKKRYPYETQFLSNRAIQEADVETGWASLPLSIGLGDLIGFYNLL